MCLRLLKRMVEILTIHDSVHNCYNVHTQGQHNCCILHLLSHVSKGPNIIIVISTFTCNKIYLIAKKNIMCLFIHSNIRIHSVFLCMTCVQLFKAFPNIDSLLVPLYIKQVCCISNGQDKMQK